MQCSPVMQALSWTVVVKRELSRKAKLSIYQLINVLAIIYGDELVSDQKKEIANTNS